MTLKLRHTHEIFTSGPRRFASGEPLEFRSAHSALAFVHSFGMRQLPLLELRTLVRELAGPGACHLDQRELLAYAARLLHADRIRGLKVRERPPEPSLDARGVVVKPAPGTAQPKTLTSWIEIELVDEDGKPVADEEYRVLAPDGGEHVGRLGSSGRARVGDIPAGTCKVSFPGLDADAWRHVASSAPL
jgi:hypothetical protein